MNLIKSGSWKSFSYCLRTKRSCRLIIVLKSSLAGAAEALLLSTSCLAPLRSLGVSWSLSMGCQHTNTQKSAAGLELWEAAGVSLHTSASLQKQLLKRGKRRVKAVKESQISCVCTLKVYFSPEQWVTMLFMEAMFWASNSSLLLLCFSWVFGRLTFIHVCHQSSLLLGFYIPLCVWDWPRVKSASQSCKLPEKKQKQNKALAKDCLLEFVVNIDLIFDLSWSNCNYDSISAKDAPRMTCKHICLMVFSEIWSYSLWRHHIEIGFLPIISDAFINSQTERLNRNHRRTGPSAAVRVEDVHFARSVS